MSKGKIVHHVTKEYMRKNKKRTFTTLFGIICMVMLMTCVFVGKDTAIKYLETLAEQSNGKWHVSAYELTDKEYKELNKIDNIEESAISADYGYSELVKSGNDERPFLHIKAYEKEVFDWMNITLKEGRLPKNKNEIVINEEAVKDGADIKIGDKISVKCFKRYIVRDKSFESTILFPFSNFQLKPGDRLEAPQGFPYYGEKTEDFFEEHEFLNIENNYTVVGFINKPGFEKKDSAAYTAICYLDKSDIATDTFNVSLKFNLNVQDNYYEKVQSTVGSDKLVEVNDLVLAFSGNSTDSTINKLVNVMSAFFVILIIAASVVLIHNVFNMSFEERSKYLGMLSSVGATGKQKRSSVYYEAFSLLCIALPIGFITGLLVIKLGMQALKPYIDKMFGMFAGASVEKVNLEISVVGIVFTIIFSVITVWMSAYLPARKIGKVGPIECIKGNIGRVKKKYKMNKRILKLFGAEGMLASNSIGREKKRAIGIIAAVSVFMIILIVTTFCTVSLDKIITYMFVDDGSMNPQFDFEYAVATEWGDESDSQYEKLKEQMNTDVNVGSVVETYVAMFGCVTTPDVISDEYWNADEKIMDAYGLAEAEKENFKNFRTSANIKFLGLDDETFEKVAASTNADKRIISDDTVFPVIVVQDGVLSTQNVRYGSDADFQIYEINQMTKKKIGDTFEVLVSNPKDTVQEFGNEYTMSVKVAGYATNDSISEYVTFKDFELWVITKKSTIENLHSLMTKGMSENKSSITKMMYVKFDNQVCPMYDTLSQMSFDTVNNFGEGVLVYNRALLDAKSIASTLKSAIRILLICFVALTSLICLLNLYNSARGRIVGQKKEYAILRSMGMTDNQLHKMLVFECGSILIRGVLISLLISTSIILVLHSALSNMMGTVVLPNVWWIYLVAIIVASITLFAITFISFNVEKTNNIIEDIRKENV